MRRRRALLGLALMPALAACGDRTPAAAPAPAPASPAAPTAPAVGAPPFREAAAETGLDFHHFNGMSGEHYMAEVTGSGVALFDYDGDGDLDVYFVQGEAIGPGIEVADSTSPLHHPVPLTDRLYRNDLDGPGGPLGFTDVTAESGLGELATGYGMGVAAGDYDNDGHVDLYVTNLGANRLLRNRGDGTFEDATDRAGVGEERWSVPAAFVDFDRDGWLDLFVGNYVSFPFDAPPVCRDFSGARDYCGPDNFTAESDRLFRNRGDGTFEDVTVAAGVEAAFGPALGISAADFNGDGRPDLYVANDQKANQLWIQQGDGTFADEALLAGAAVNRSGQAEASMGVDAADYDGDGDLDLFLTHLVTETNTLYRNDGSGMFDDATEGSGLGAPSVLATSFGTAWLDFDLDGSLDLYVASGAVRRVEALVRAGDPFPLHERNQLFQNLGEGRFREITEAAGAALASSEVSRGAAFGDLDDDGDPDIVVSNNSGPARLLLAQAPESHRWVGLRLVDAAGRRDMLGAIARLRRADGTDLWRRVRVDGSYASANDPRIRFGLGPDPDAGPASVQSVEVTWPDGTIESWSDIPLDRYTTLRQGSGRLE